MALELSHLVIFIISLIALLCLYLIVSLYFLRKYQAINKERVSEQKDYFPMFYFVAFLFLSIGRLFLAIFDVITEFDSNNYTLENFVIWKIGTAFQLCAWGLFFIVIEKKAMKGRDKYILFILYAAFCIIGVALNDIVWATNLIVVAFLFSIYIPFAYLYIVIVSDGSVRKKALYAFLGFLIVLIGALLTGETVIDLFGIERILMHPISYIVKAIGCIFLYLGFK
jgi:hypothetical protein